MRLLLKLTGSTMVGCLETMFIHELTVSVEAREHKVTTSCWFKCGDSSTGFVTRMKLHIEGLENAQ